MRSVLRTWRAPSGRPPQDGATPQPRGMRGGFQGTVSRVLSRAASPRVPVTIIPLGPPLPTGSSTLPRSIGRAALERSIVELAPSGVCLADPVSRAAGELLPHPFNLTEAASRSPTLTPRSAACGPVGGGLLSVALSSGSPRPGITRHPALWCSDFPPVAARAGTPPRSSRTTGDRLFLWNGARLSAGGLGGKGPRAFSLRPRRPRPPDRSRPRCAPSSHSPSRSRGAPGRSSG